MLLTREVPWDDLADTDGFNVDDVLFFINSLMNQRMHSVRATEGEHRVDALNILLC